MNCKVTIISKGEGFESDIKTSGVLKERENSFTLNYSIEGDECALSYDGGAVTQQRRGGQNIEMTFIKDKTTACKIGTGNFAGEFPLYCKDINFTKDECGIKLSLKYNCGEGDINLCLTADYQQEIK